MALLEILSEQNACDFDSLKEAYISRTGANLATLYRGISDFRDAGLIHALYEHGVESFVLCAEIRNGREPSRHFELTHCHGCGSISDEHFKNSAGNILESHRETHVGNCPSCVTKAGHDA